MDDATRENEIHTNIRAALVDALVFYIPHCEATNEDVPDVLQALTNGVVNLRFEVELDPVGQRVYCALKNPSSGKEGFLFEITAPGGVETVQ
jgi:hypothetical protein